MIRKRIAGVVFVGMLAVLVANASGAAPLPTGPMGSLAGAVPDPGGVSTLDYYAGGSPRYLTPVVENTGPVAVTIVRVTPVGDLVPGSVVVLGSMPFDTSDPNEFSPDGMDRIALGVVEDPGPGWAAPQPVAGVSVEPKGPAMHQGRAFLVRVTPDPTREVGVLRFDVEYAIGPVHFVTTAWGPVGTTITICPAERPKGGENGCGAG